MNEQPSSGIARNYSCARIGVSAYPAQMAHSAATKLTSGMSGEIVLQRAGYGCIDHLARHEHAARTGDAEGIHQIRVAVRRWRATLSALAPIMSKESRRRASDQLRGIADALSEARNLDVFACAAGATARCLPVI